MNIFFIGEDKEVNIWNSAMSQVEMRINYRSNGMLRGCLFN